MEPDTVAETGLGVIGSRQSPVPRTTDAYFPYVFYIGGD
jgi:hypothetical protein